MRALWRERGGSYSTNPRTLELDVGLARVFVDVPEKLRVRARYVLGIGPRFTISRDRLRFIVIEEMKGGLPRPVPERFWKALDQGWLGTDDVTVQYGGDVGDVLVDAVDLVVAIASAGVEALEPWKTLEGGAFVAPAGAWDARSMPAVAFASGVRLEARVAAPAGPVIAAAWVECPRALEPCRRPLPELGAELVVDAGRASVVWPGLENDPTKLVGAARMLAGMIASGAYR